MTVNDGLDRLKHETAQELGLVSPTQSNSEGFHQAMDRLKYEHAQELGLLGKVQRVGWGDMTARECGRIGGPMGGRLGGQMVRKMIQFAERNME